MQIDDKDFFDKIASKQDEISKELAKMNLTLAEQKGVLDMHIYRTDLAEQNIALLKKSVEDLQKKDNFVQGGLKLLGAISAIAGFIYIILQISGKA